MERIIIDECHMILESQADWRPQVLQLCGMAPKGGTGGVFDRHIAPGEEVAFYQAIGVEEKGIWLLRDITSRPNIAFSIREYPREEEERAVQALVQAKKEQYPDG